VSGLDDAIERIARGIREREAARKKVSEGLRALKSSVEIREVSDAGAELLEETLFVKMTQDGSGGFEGRVAGIDGGLLAMSFHGVDLLVARAVGVVFSYSGGRLASCEYFPEKSPQPAILELPQAQDSEVRLLSGLNRTLLEIECALACAKKFSPDVLILHGPVGPHLSTKPDKGSPARAVYERLNSAYLELYGHCGGKKTALLGVVEDSRGGRFSEIASKHFLPPTLSGLSGIRDTALLFDALEHGERTFAFKYAASPGEHPVLSDLKEWGGRLYSFYAKTAECDRPIRVDFLAFDGAGSVGHQADAIASGLFSMSHWNRAYGLPPVLIEADCRARLSEDEGEFIRNMVFDKVGRSPLTLDLRRSGRPF
jgi:hypothetical protein